jgi:polar amino acid transport system substrate-binding protein
MTNNLLNRRDILIVGSIAAATMIAGNVAARADALANVKSSGAIKIGIFEDFPPFASLGQDMKIAGYDVDMAGKIAAALGVKAQLVAITGQNRIPFLTEGKVDVLLSIGYSDERAKVVDFTDPYAPYYIVVMGPPDIVVKSAADLKGKTIAANKGTLEDTELTKIAPDGTTIQRFNDYNGVISAFLSCQAQLMVVGNDVGANILAKNPPVKPEEKFQLLSSPSNMAVKKGETGLRDELNKLVTAMKSDGSLNDMSKKWLHEPLPADFK